MNKIIIAAMIITSLFFVSCTHCVSGNCRDGYGKTSKGLIGKYEGEWKNGKWHGQGTIYYTNGSKYVGMMQNDKMNGYGSFFYFNGDSIYRSV